MTPKEKAVIDAAIAFSRNGEMHEAREELVGTNSMSIPAEFVILMDSVTALQQERGVYRFQNFYVHCGQRWDDAWDCMCNNKCSICGGEIEPFLSIELDDQGGHTETTLHVGKDFIPEGGWPEGITNLEQLEASCTNQRK